jgi:hypothetical protein
MRYMEDQDPNSFKELDRALGNYFLPNLMPTFLTPIVETLSNWDFYRDRPIEPERLRRLEPGRRAYPYTTQIGKMAGQKLGFSPIQAEHLLQGYGGTMSLRGLQAMDWLGSKTGIFQRPERPAEGILEMTPGLRALVVQPSISSSSSEAFFDLSKKAETASATLKNLQENDPEKSIDYEQRHYRQILVLPDVRKILKEIYELQDEWRQVSESDKPAKIKKQNLKVIQDEINARADMGTELLRGHTEMNP